MPGRPDQCALHPAAEVSCVDPDESVFRFAGRNQFVDALQRCHHRAVYVLVAIVKKRLNLEAALYSLLPILPVTLFEQIPLLQALPHDHAASIQPIPNNQLNLFAL